MEVRQRGSCSIRCRRWVGQPNYFRLLWLQLVDDIRSLAAGTGIALSGVPMVCQREEQQEGLVVELSVVAAILTS